MGALSIWHVFVLLVLLVMIAVVVGFVIFLVKVSGSGHHSSRPAAMAPGWYPDGSDPTRVRWFDGHRWTGRTQPRVG